MFSGRYRVVSTLKDGHWIETMLAIDAETGDEVVVKAASSADISAPARLRLQHEAEMLGSIQSDSLASLLHFGTENGTIFLVMPFVPGVTLRGRLDEGPLDLRDTLTVGCAILQALQEAHDHGVLHGDVKPANVMVDEHSPLEGATLIDFGLARSARLHPSLQASLAGTARYVSPEQAGLLDHEVDERSDLYSAGVLLFECLAGRPPFEADTVGEILRLHLTAEPPDLRALGLEVPRVLAESLGRLMRKDPRDRYQSAAAAGADLLEIATAWDRGITDPAMVVGLHDRRATLTEPAFVGREGELSALDAELEVARRGRGGLVVVEAESGGGKTRLLDELAQRSARRGDWVLRGQGTDQAAPRPFQLLAGLAEGIRARGEIEPGLPAALRARLGERCTAVSAAMPELSNLLAADEDLELGPEAFGETRSLDALGALLDTLGEPGRPAVVLFDDCQWADGLTVKLLERWIQRRAGPRGMTTYALVVVAFRSEEVAADHPLRALACSAALRLPPFGDEHVERLVESMAGELPAEAVDTVRRLCEGNPFMASAVLRGLVESGALVYSGEKWSVHPEELAVVQSSRQAAVFLARRLDLLPAATRRLLGVGAVLGKQFDFELVCDLARTDTAETVAALDEARSRHIVWLTADGGAYAFVHDKLREALLERMAPEMRTELHRRAAQRIEDRDPNRAFELAYHFDAAGESERALPYALRAGAEARARHALEVAEEQYRIAERGAVHAGPASRLEIAEGLGDVLMLRGSYDMASGELEKALALAETQLTMAQLEGKLGELAFKRGDMATASSRIEAALRTLGRRVPRTRLGYLIAVAGEVASQALHTLMPRFFLGRRELEGAEAELLAVHLHSRLAHAYWFQRGQVPTLWTHLRGMNLAERYPPTPDLAMAWSEHAPVMTVVPYMSRGIAYAAKSLEVRRSLGDLWGQGQSLHFYGIVLYAASRFEDCIERCREGVRLLERTGDRWELNTASWHIAFSHYRLGNLEQAVDTAQAVHRAGLDIGDPQASGISLGAWAKASGGRIPADVVAAELARPTDDVHTRAEVLQAEAVRLIAAGRPGEAAEMLEEAARLVDEKGLKQEYVSPIQPWLATALREQAERLPVFAGPERDRLLRRARRAARRGTRIAGSYRNNLPHALRERGMLEAARGRPRRARALLERSLGVATDQDARYEQALTRLARGRVGIAYGWEGAAAEADHARGEIAVMLPSGPDAGPVDWESEPVTLSLADRFNLVLDSGRRIASALSRETIHDTVREAALTILRGEQCIVLEVDSEGTIAPALGEDGEIDELCRTMAERALHKQGPVIWSRESAEQDTTTDSMALAGVRSAMCAPVFARGRTVNCFYVSHRGVEDLFREDEERLAGYIATLAGAALENAEGFAKVQGLTKTLEARVAERTSQVQETNRQLDVSLSKLREAYDRERDTADQMKHQAFHDSLTGLANRALFTDRVEHALARAVRLDTRVAVLFLDLDDFKTVNDSLGHTVGDELLVSVATRIRARLREVDTPARLGGDEFAVLIEDVNDPSDASMAAERVLQAMEAPFSLDGNEVFIHGSLGIALAPTTGSEESDASALLRNADVAMYMAKSEGKRHYRFFEPSMHAGVVERLEMKADLQRAFENEEFAIHYQPIVELATGRISGFEALIRWRHLERGLLSPDGFIGLAEETGLIRPLGRWVMREACLQRLAWGAADGITISVNLSPRQVHEPELVDEVVEILEETGMDPELLVLEITEGVFMRDTDTTINRLRELKDLGVKLAIDDFGTGYSSLEYLKRFPIDVIKVAKPFVDDLGATHPSGETSEGAALARAIVDLGEAFNLVSVAEGIERPDQLERLRELGCRLGQGYLFARPLPGPEATELLRLGRPL